MSKHTPGPWSVAGMQTGRPEWNDMRHIFSSHDRNAGGTGHVAKVVSSDANARLIAAAPDMLEALATIVREFNCGRTPLAKDIEAARAAIAKAEGGKP